MLHTIGLSYGSATAGTRLHIHCMPTSFCVAGYNFPGFIQVEYPAGVQRLHYQVCPKFHRATMCTKQKDDADMSESALVSFEDEPKPEPSPDGTLRHVFYMERDESALSAKLMLWKGWKDIVSFEGMLNNAMEAVNTHGNSEEDLRLLHELELGFMACGAADAPLYRFLCIPETCYSESRLPTGIDIIRELKNSENFQGVQLRGSSLQATNILFPTQRNEGGDVVHNDPEEQHTFVLESMLDEQDEMSTRVENEKSIAAHSALRNYVLRNHLTMLYSIPRRNTKKTRFPCPSMCLLSVYHRIPATWCFLDEYM